MINPDIPLTESFFIPLTKEKITLSGENFEENNKKFLTKDNQTFSLTLVDSPGYGNDLEIQDWRNCIITELK